MNVLTKMKIKAIIISVFFSLFAAASFAQIDLYMVHINGKVTDFGSGEPIPYAHIVNPRLHGGTTSNVDGYFSIDMLTEDTLFIRAVGYVETELVLQEFPPKPLYEVKLKPVRYLLDEVLVNESLNMRKRFGLPEFDPLDIPVELRGDAFNEKPPWYAALLTPISFLQYHTSSREKQKRETLKIIRNNEEWLEFSEHHNLQTIKKLTGLQGTAADQFMFYCNLNNRLPYHAGQMEIEFQIMDLYFKYKKEQQTKSAEP